MEIHIKRLNGNTPKYLDILLNRNSDVHNWNTRFSNVNLVCPLFKKSTEGGRTFPVRTIRDWNNLDVKCKQIHSLMLFKRILLEHFLEYQEGHKVISNSILSRVLPSWNKVFQFNSIDWTSIRHGVFSKVGKLYKCSLL